MFPTRHERFCSQNLVNVQRKSEEGYSSHISASPEVLRGVAANLVPREALGVCQDTGAGVGWAVQCASGLSEQNEKPTDDL